MAFDADAFRAALEPPTVTIDGTRYVGRLVSADEWSRWLAVMEGYRAKKISAAAADRALKRLLRAAFPYRIEYGWRGDPAAKLLGLDPVTREAFLDDFFASLAKRRTTSQGETPPTPGSASPTPTAPAPDAPE